MGNDYGNMGDPNYREGNKLMMDYDMYLKPPKKSWKDWLPKWTSILIWMIILFMITCYSRVYGQFQNGYQSGVIYPSAQVEIVGYRIVMSEKYGCWSELQIINESRYTGVKRELIIDKITKYELYGMSSGESPMLEIQNNNGSISYYHIVKLPSDVSW